MGTAPPPAFRDPAHAQAASIVVAAATAARRGHRHGDTLDAYADDRGRLSVHGGGPLTARDVAEGATVLIERVVIDVGRLLNIDPDETLALTGQWVAEQEV